ncbi:hypothetical protein BLOT_008967, partial [Blomia tropicalis]
MYSSFNEAINEEQRGHLTLGCNQWALTLTDCIPSDNIDCYKNKEKKRARGRKKWIKANADMTIDDNSGHLD